MNKENAVGKINKYGKIGKIITTILMVFAGIGIVSTIIAGIAIMCIPEDIMTFSMDNKVTLEVNTDLVPGNGITDDDKDMIISAFNSDAHTGFNLGAVKFSLDNVEFVDGKMIAISSGSGEFVSLNKLGFAVLSAAVALILTFVSLLFGRKLCKAFETCESPFDEDVIVKMKHFAIALLPWAVYSSVPNSIMSSILNSSLEMNLNLDLNVIFTVLVIWALSTVFSYGAELQRESDETL